jgi:hypothetical protein
VSLHRCFIGVAHALIIIFPSLCCQVWSFAVSCPTYAYAEQFSVDLQLHHQLW